MCSLPFEYCEWGPQFPKCKEWFQGNFQRFYPEVGTADLAHEDVVALMTRLGFEGEPDAAATNQASHTLRPPLAPAGQLGPITGYIELALGALFPTRHEPEEAAWAPS